MKKILFIICCLLLPLGIYAIDDWHVSEVHVFNEIDSTNVYYKAYWYRSEIGRFVIYDNTDSYIKIISDDGPFEYMTSAAFAYDFFILDVKFHNENNKVINKFVIECHNENGFSHSAYSYDTANCRRIISYLADERGYIRITAPKTNGIKFDMSIPCNSSLKKL